MEGWIHEQSGTEVWINWMKNGWTNGANFFSSLHNEMQWMNTCLQSSPSVIVARGKYQQMLQHPVLGAQKHGTPWKFEIDPENKPSQEESNPSNHYFSGAMLNFGGVIIK